MLNNVVLDVFIGLIFIFLLYSLLAVVIQEIIARWFGLRGRMLVKAIVRMLEDQDARKIMNIDASTSTAGGLILSIGKSIKRYFSPFAKGNKSFAKAFFTFPSIKYLAEGGFNTKPSYIEDTAFSQTVLYLLRGKMYDGTTVQMDIIKDSLFGHKTFERNDETKVPIDPETIQHLQRLFIDSNSDIDRFKALLEKWFKETMDRASGWYKRKTQLILFFIGLGIAFTFNIDTIAIYNVLAKDKKVREQIVQLALKAPEKYAPIFDSLSLNQKNTTVIPSVDTLYKKADSLSKDTVYIMVSDAYVKQTMASLQKDANDVNNILGLGRPLCDSLKVYKNILDESAKNHVANLQVQAKYDLIKKQIGCKNFKYSPIQQGGFFTFFGWLITALAISLGAPFWFDLLTKLIQLRNAGVKPQKDISNTTTDKETGYTNQPIKRVG